MVFETLKGLATGNSNKIKYPIPSQQLIIKGQLFIVTELHRTWSGDVIALTLLNTELNRSHKMSLEAFKKNENKIK